MIVATTNVIKVFLVADLIYVKSRFVSEFPPYFLTTKKRINAGLSSALDFKSNLDNMLTTLFLSFFFFKHKKKS